MRKIILLFLSVHFLLPAFGQIHDRSVTTARSQEMMETYQRKMNALLEEIGMVAIDTPGYIIDNVDVVTWLKNNKPSVYASNKDFLDAFAKDYLGVQTKEEAPRKFIDWYYKFYNKILDVSEDLARRLVGAWRNG